MDKLNAFISEKRRKKCSVERNVERNMQHVLVINISTLFGTIRLSLIYLFGKVFVCIQKKVWKITWFSLDKKFYEWGITKLVEDGQRQKTKTEESFHVLWKYHYSLHVHYYKFTLWGSLFVGINSKNTWRNGNKLGFRDTLTITEKWYQELILIDTFWAYYY